MLMIYTATFLSACCAAAEPQLPLPEDTLAAIDLDQVKARLKQHKVSLNVSLTGPLVALGRQLFFDPILSEDNSVSCATCHRPANGFAAPDAVAIGIRKQKGTRNTPTILNRALGKSQFWDGRADSLEEQSLKPIANPLEMGSSVKAAVDRLKSSDRIRSCLRRRSIRRTMCRLFQKLGLLRRWQRLNVRSLRHRVLWIGFRTATIHR